MTASEFVTLDWQGRKVRIEHQWIAQGLINRPLIVFLHEGLGSLSMWKDFPSRLCHAAGARGLVYSRPGYGRSTPREPDERWATDYMHHQAHEVLPALLDALHVDEKPWLFGHSDGASIALLHASRFPASVAGLVVLAPHIFTEEYGLRSIRQARDAYASTDLRARLSRYHDDVDSAFWGWNRIWLAPAFEAWNIERDLAAIRCPVLAVQGLDDEYGTLAQVNGIAKHVPQARLLELADCRHSPHRDQPDALIDAATRFIQTHHDGDTR
jgi:pimeloyl-ACP methyl ester carboxylesterase